MAQATDTDTEDVMEFALQDTTVVDFDVHVGAPQNVRSHAAEYLPDPYRTQMDPATGGNFGAYPSTGVMVEIPDQWEGNTQVDGFGMEDVDKDLREALMERFGVDYPIVNMGAAGIDRIPESQRIVPEMQAINNTLLDLYLDGNDDVFGAATLTTQQPDKAAEEIDRLASEDQIVAGYLGLGYIDPPLGDSRYDIMWEAAQDNDFGFIFHSSHGDSIHYPNLHRGLDTFLASHTLLHPVSHMIHLVHMVYEGVPIKFPDVNFICVESGLGWAATMMGRMNRDYPERRFDAPLLEKEPEEYIRDNWFFANQPIEEYNDPMLAQHFMEILGPECIVYASDHPHFDFDYPSMIKKYYSNFTKEEQDQIFHGNAPDALPRLGKQIDL